MYYILIKFHFFFTQRSEHEIRDEFTLQVFGFASQLRRFVFCRRSSKWLHHQEHDWKVFLSSLKWLSYSTILTFWNDVYKHLLFWNIYYYLFQLVWQRSDVIFNRISNVCYFIFLNLFCWIFVVYIQLRPIVICLAYFQAWREHIEF